MNEKIMNDKISIIIPVYNAEKYLVECLDSVVNQTYSNYQVIMINDGSKDGSESICRKYAEKDDRFILFSGPNHGSSGARNIGLQHVEGDYIAFLDSDDWYDTDYLEYLLNGLKKNNADIYYCDFKTNGVPEYKWDDCVMSGKEALYGLVAGGCCNRTPNKLYRRETVGDVLFPDGRNLCEDASWTARVLERAGTVARGNEAKYNIRLTEGSITRKRMRKESEVCAYCRNLLDRCEVLLRNYPESTDQRNAIVNECDRCFKIILDFGCNLDLWDVFKTAKKMINDHPEIFGNGDSKYCRYFKDCRNYKAANRKYMLDTLMSRKVRLADKKAVVYKRLVSTARRVLKKS